MSNGEASNAGLSERDQVRRLMKLRWDMLHFLYCRWLTLKPNHLQSIPADAAGAEIGVADESELQNIFMYLKDAGLIKFMSMGPSLAITRVGIDEVEQALSEPDAPTEHFKPVNVINVWGGMHGSQIQQASAHSSQVIENGARIDWPELRKILVDLRQDAASLPDAQRSAVEADIDTVLAQSGSSAPRVGFVRECLGSLRRVFESGTAGVAAGRLLLWLQQHNW